MAVAPWGSSAETSPLSKTMKRLPLAALTRVARMEKPRVAGLVMGEVLSVGRTLDPALRNKILYGLRIALNKLHPKALRGHGRAGQGLQKVLALRVADGSDCERVAMLAGFLLRAAGVERHAQEPRQVMH